MKVKVTMLRAVLAATTLVVVGLVILINFTEVLNLQAVTLNGEPVDNWQSDYGLSGNRRAVDQPVDSLANQILQQQGVVKVDVDVDLPGEIEIRTNNFEPVCFVVDRSSGRMKGLNTQARVVVLNRQNLDWEHPVLTNVTADKLYDYCEDPRVRVLVPQLLRFRDDNVDFYRLIEEIDFESNDCLVVSVSGFDFRLKVNAEGFYEQLNEFITFLEQFDTDLSDTRSLDLRLDNMIVQTGEKK